MKPLKLEYRRDQIYSFIKTIYALLDEQMKFMDISAGVAQSMYLETVP